MVRTQKQFFFSPTVVASIITTFLLYSGLLNVGNRNGFTSLLPNSDIIMVEGVLHTNAAKTANGKYYVAKADIISTATQQITSQASGQIQILIPTEIVEALYPGKLYSKVYSTTEASISIVEQGLHFISNGYFITQDNMESTAKHALFIADSFIGQGWRGFYTKHRALFRLEFKRLLYSWGDAGGLLLALLSGSREYTDSKLSEGFKNAGLSHILALSGMHLSLFASMALTTGKLINKRVGTIFSLFAISLFVWFAGLSPSLFRAFVCTLIALLLDFCALPGVSGNSEVLYRFISPSFSSIRLLRILSVSFLIHVCVFPNDIFSAAFMLSYGALVGIALAEYAIKPWLMRIVPNALASSLSAAIGAQLCTAPVTISLFGTLMPIGIVSSVVVTPFALCFLVLGFLCIVISAAIPFLLYPIGDIIQLLYRLLEGLVLWFSQFPSIQF